MKDFFSELKRRNVVRVAIAYAVVSWLIIQVGDVAADNLNFPDWFMPMVFVVLGLGFPVALIVSWAFELTPEGLKKTKEVDRSKSVTHGTGQKINKLIATGLVLAIGFIIYDQFFASDRPMHQAEAANASIAVLPFVNMSSDPEQEFFSDGISEELLNVLAKIPELQVAGRTSSFAFKGQNQDLREIGETLGVAFLLEGSVRKQGDKVRITAQLISASDGIHLWSETYDRTLDDVFAIQDEISAAIVRELQTRILGGLSAPTAVAQKVDPEAHSLYLLGLQRQNQDASQPYLDARGYYKRALELSPEYLDALWGLGFVTADLFGFGTISEAEARKDINEVLVRLGALGAGNDPRALLLQGELEHLDGNHDREGELALEAYAANPNDPRIVVEASNAYSRNNNNAKAVEILQKALRRDPLSLKLLRTLSGAQRGLGQFEEAETTIKKMVEIDPGYSEGYFQVAILDFQKGKWAEALKNWQKVREIDPIDPDIPAIMAAALRTAGFYEEATAYLDEADAMSPNEVFSIATRAAISAGKGEFSVAGVMAENLIFSDRKQHLNSSEFAMTPAISSFVQTGQFERLERLVLAHIPELARPLDEFRKEGDSIGALNHKIAHVDDLAYALIGMGREEEAKALLEKSIEVFMDISPDAETSERIFYHLILLGRLDEAVRRLGLEENIADFMIVRADPLYEWRLDPLKGHSRYEALAAKIDARVDAERAKIRAWLDTQKTE